jgi:hypothetical protein
MTDDIEVLEIKRTLDGRDHTFRCTMIHRAQGCLRCGL